MSLAWRIVRKIFTSVFLLFVTFVVAPTAAVATVVAGLIFLPLPATLPVPKPPPISEPTTIYDRNGNVIATLVGANQDVPVSESDIPALLKEAVISDEDRNFYRHGGVDLRGTLRALVADLRNKKVVQGGSTITQQYVKLAYTGSQRNVARKVREAILASQLDRQVSKDEILYRYLTLVYFGDGYTGVGAAAQGYFRVDVGQLDASQAATLAGLIPAPSARAPRENLTAAEAGRELVLAKMHDQGYLTDGQYEQAMSERLVLAASGAPPAQTTVVYPVPSTTVAYPDFVDYVTRWLLTRFPPSMVYGGGLRVQTTLDPKVQDEAYAAVRSTLTGTGAPLEMALAAVEPSTGFVAAIVGGRSFGQGPYADVNLALGGCDPEPRAPAVVEVPATCWTGSTITGGGSGRQPGSAWKPFVLAAAFEQGIPPTETLPAPGVYVVPGCRPTSAFNCQIHNDEPGAFGGVQTLQQAMANSTNTVYAQLAPIVGCPEVAKTAKAMGIESAYYSSSVFTYCQGYALGELDVSPLDMASAYGVFADHGQRADPTPILEIQTASGKTLVDNIHHTPAVTRILPANVADNMTTVLEGVLTGGTGTAAALGRPAAGKTGTTSNYTNAWFVGYTPTLSTAVWMGQANSGSAPIGRVDGVEPVYGGTLPALTWKQFMLQALTGVAVTPFDVPAPILPLPKALPASTTTTQPPVLAGPPGVVGTTPAGGPYLVPPARPVAPLPVVPTSTTVPPTSSTTGPASTPTSTPVQTTTPGGSTSTTG
jgi:penicillin-binding protein 1A